MTKRSLQVLSRKLRALEDAHVRDTERTLGNIVLAVMQQARPIQRSWLAAVPDTVALMLTRAGESGILLLAEFTSQNGVGLTRDTRAIVANSGVDAAPVVRQWDPFGWQYGAETQLIQTLLVMRGRILDQIGKQVTFATRDEDIAQSIWDRMFSRMPMGRMGRRGVGVMWSAVSMMARAPQNAAYSMVNEQRQSLLRPIARLVNGEDVP